jgi:hypothetical protein
VHANGDATWMEGSGVPTIHLGKAIVG